MAVYDTEAVADLANEAPPNGRVGRRLPTLRRQQENSAIKIQAELYPVPVRFSVHLLRGPADSIDFSFPHKYVLKCTERFHFNKAGGKRTWQIDLTQNTHLKPIFADHHPRPLPPRRAAHSCIINCSELRGFCHSTTSK